MKKPRLQLLVSLALMAYLIHVQPSAAQGTTFTYQGRLTDHGTNYTGTAEFQPTLWDDVTGGTKVADHSPTSLFINVSDGLFTLPLDFGATPFAGGSNRWLQLEVRTVIGPFAALTPRQSLTPTPYAIVAGSLTGIVPATQLSGTIASSNVAGSYGNVVAFTNAGNSFAGNGGGLTNLNATTLGGFGAGQFWGIGGNSATSPTNGNFLGTVDDQPLELRINGTRVIRLERQTNSPVFGFVLPNVIAGFESNHVGDGVGGATIAGGGGPQWYGVTPPNTVNGSFSTIGGGVGNVANGVVNTIAGGERGFTGTNAYNAFVGGGAWNTVDAGDATIGGGRYNSIRTFASSSFLGGGEGNRIGTNSSHSVIGGGYYNTISNYAHYATISGGYFNTIANDARFATIPGGYSNTASGVYSFAVGANAKANHYGAFVWSDASSTAAFASTAANQFSVRAAGGIRFVTSGAGLSVDGQSTFGDLSLEEGGNYHHLQLSGGNSLGYLYGSFLKFGDGVHLGYNYYADASGNDQIPNTGGATSRLTTGYGFVGIFVGGVDAAPTTERLYADSTGVRVDGTFNNNSDRNVKQDFQPVSSAQILDQVARLPLCAWSYKEDPHTRHVGPMAQDFHALFGIGTDDKHIAPIDEGGIAFAAIQGLNQKLEDRSRDSDLSLQKLQAENTELKRRLEALEQIILHLKSN